MAAFMSTVGRSRWKKAFLRVLSGKESPGKDVKRVGTRDFSDPSVWGKHRLIMLHGDFAS